MLAGISAHGKVSLSNLANCRLKLEDFEGAESSFRSAVGLGYNDQQGLELFGLAQFKLGKFSEAIATVTGVVQVDQANLRGAKCFRAVITEL